MTALDFFLVDLFGIYLPVFYTTLFLFAFSSCFRKRARCFDSIVAALFLLAIHSTSYHGYWESPKDMVSYRGAVLLFMMFTPDTKFWGRFFLLSFIGLMADSLYMVMPDITPFLQANLPAMPLNIPYSIFWWQRILDVLFVALCFITLRECYSTRHYQDEPRGLKNDIFYAFVPHKSGAGKRAFS